MANVEGIFKSFVPDNEAPLDKRTLYKTVDEFLSAPENAYEETFVPLPPPGRTEINTTRFIGQKVMIQNPPEGGSPCEYWFKDGITDSDFVKLNYEGSTAMPNIEPNNDTVDISNVTGTVNVLAGTYSDGILTIKSNPQAVGQVSGTISVAKGSHTHGVTT